METKVSVTQTGPFTSVAMNPCPEASTVVVPLPSFKGQYPNKFCKTPPVMLPSSSIRITASDPTVRVFSEAPGWLYPLMTTGSVMVGSADPGWMVCGPAPGI